MLILDELEVQLSKVFVSILIKLPKQ